MDKIDVLIQRIDEEITRHSNKLTELKLNNEDINMREILTTNRKYLQMFREMAIEVKEEK